MMSPDLLFLNTAALLQVVLVDLALAGDNAVAVALAAAALPEKQRRSAIMWGIGIALGLRVVFSLGTAFVLHNRSLLLPGGLLLLWVAWRMLSDLNAKDKEDAPTPVEAKEDFRRALFSIVVADVTMSLDNVLAVGSIARETPIPLAIGLVLSVVLMGVSAGLIARLMNRHRWIAWLGVIVIVLAALQMIWNGSGPFYQAVSPWFR